MNTALLLGAQFEWSPNTFMDSGNQAPFAVSLWFAPARRLRSSAAELPAVVVSGNPIGAGCDEVEMPEATMDLGWMDALE